MEYELAENILDQIEQTNLSDLMEDLFHTAIRYSQIRSIWYCSSLEKRKEIDKQRTISHDAFIDCCNILSRNMAKIGEDNSWRFRLGDDRKEIGDFACYLSCVLGIRAR